MVSLFISRETECAHKVPQDMLKTRQRFWTMPSVAAFDNMAYL